MRFKTALSAGAVLAICGSAIARPQSYSGGSYSQNFDTLPTTGTPAAWSNDTTLTGWYALFVVVAAGGTGRDPGGAAVTGIRANDGTTTNGALYSYGTGTNAERALGSIGSGSASQVFALVLQNTTGNTYTGFNMSFTSEQWRDGGQGTFAPVVHRFEFDFKVVASFLVSEINESNTAGYTTNPNLDAISVFSGASGVARDGNNPVNQSARSGSGVTTWAPNEFLILRWWDENNLGSDHGIALDNLTFEGVPAPGALALAGLGGLMLVRRRR